MLAIIAGTGIEQLASLDEGEKQTIITKYGKADLYCVDLQGERIVFLPRHNLNHNIAPHLINHRANIAALKECGVDRILALCSVGSLRVDLVAGSLVLLQDFINAAGGSLSTFYADKGSPVVHTDLSVPYCPTMRDAIESACRNCNVGITTSGTYVGVMGPRYESPAEVRAFRMLGGDVVGMTNVPECVLAHEAGICYCAIAVVTNLGSGLSRAGLSHDEVTRNVRTVTPVLETIIKSSLSGIINISECKCRKQSVDIL